MDSSKSTYNIEHMTQNKDKQKKKKKKTTTQKIKKHRHQQIIGVDHSARQW